MLKRKDEIEDRGNLDLATPENIRSDVKLNLCPSSTIRPFTSVSERSSPAPCWETSSPQIESWETEVEEMDILPSLVLEMNLALLFSLIA